MSEFPYEDKIHGEDRVNYKTVFSSDRMKIGKVEASIYRVFHCKVRKRKYGDKI